MQFHPFICYNYPEYLAPDVQIATIYQQSLGAPSVTSLPQLSLVFGYHVAHIQSAPPSAGCARPFPCPTAALNGIPKLPTDRPRIPGSLQPRVAPNLEGGYSEHHQRVSVH